MARHPDARPRIHDCQEHLAYAMAEFAGVKKASVVPRLPLSRCGALPYGHSTGQRRSPGTRRCGRLNRRRRTQRLIKRSFAARRRSAAPRRARLEMSTRHKPFRSVRPACQCLPLCKRARRQANRKGWGCRGVALDQHSRNLMRFCGSPQLEARNREACYLRVGDPPRGRRCFRS